MTDYAWPASIIPSASAWRLMANTAAFVSPLTGATRTVGRGGDRWACTLTVNNAGEADRAVLSAWLARLRGQTHRVKLPEHALRRRGSFATGELLVNTTFDTTAGWSSSDTGEIVISADTGAVRSTRVAATVTRAVRHDAAITTTANARYLLRAHAIAGKGTPRWSLRLGTTTGATDIVNSSTFAAEGSGHVATIVSGTTVYASIGDVFTGKVAGDYQLFARPSFARCLIVNGGSQSGSALWVRGALPASTAGLLLMGDFVSVYTSAGWELKQLTQNFDSDASAYGNLVFTPPLRGVPDDDAPVAVHDPYGAFLLVDNTVGWSNVPGRRSSFSVDFVEDIAP